MGQTRGGREVTKLGDMLSEPSRGSQPRVYLMSLAEVETIQRLLAVLEAARQLGNGHDPMCAWREAEELDRAVCTCGWGPFATALAACDQDPLLSSIAPSAPTEEGK